ncbi:type II secretion system F family protein [Oceanidesulfovibrio marinus]|uniref:Type II secretion system F family protein n=1 Tax=Oceanidesulfovibrio marinus TaxID=370038 RepID=A0A6P1ZG46_9BACT|nr:type II secretion system F family protein [Oceanidesulfovibrio marinus]QJT08378.1 type II secretion system F family protein [Oceanidesulfovibrio marinus]TVM33151.1 type II secretion system F family protein [Oceanidesulfovibrio marinus]
MPNYSYQAVTETGTEVSGTLEADSTDDARQILAARGLIPSRVVRNEPGSNLIKTLNDKLSTVSVPDLILFTKQFRTMFNAGLSIIALLDVLEQQCENPKLKSAVVEIGQDIKQGSSLFNAFSKHENIFSPLYCSMLRAGEISGTLPDVLDRLIYIIEHEYKVKKQIKSALLYPQIVIVLLIGAFIFLLTFVIPQFVKTFKKAGIELPLPTKVCIFLYEFLDAYWVYLIGVVIGLIALIWLYLRTDSGKLIKDRFILRMPIVGPVFQKGAMARFASIFSLLQASGVSVLESVGIVSNTIGNAAISLEFDNLRDKLQEGRGISGPLRNSRTFTPMIINMIAIGEETGELDLMMREVAKHYDYEVEYQVGRMSELIGPILIVCLAGVVGFFAAAILFPIFDLTKMVK